MRPSLPQVIAGPQGIHIILLQQRGYAERQQGAAVLRRIELDDWKGLVRVTACHVKMEEQSQMLLSQLWKLLPQKAVIDH